METEGRALSDGEVGDQPDQIPSEYRIERRTEMEKTDNVRMRGLTPLRPMLVGRGRACLNRGNSCLFDVSQPVQFASFTIPASAIHPTHGNRRACSE